jgi:hypothetical protein
MCPPNILWNFSQCFTIQLPFSCYISHEPRTTLGCYHPGGRIYGFLKHILPRKICTKSYNEMKTPIVDVNLPNFIVRQQCCNCTEGKKGRERDTHTHTQVWIRPFWLIFFFCVHYLAPQTKIWTGSNCGQSENSLIVRKRVRSQILQYRYWPNDSHTTKM